MLTKNIIGMRKTFEHRNHGRQNARNMYWMLHDHTLDALKWIKHSRKQFLDQEKSLPESLRAKHRARYREVVAMWI